MLNNRFYTASKILLSLALGQYLIAAEANGTDLSQEKPAIRSYSLLEVMPIVGFSWEEKKLTKLGFEDGNFAGRDFTFGAFASYEGGEKYSYSTWTGLSDMSRLSPTLFSEKMSGSLKYYNSVDGSKKLSNDDGSSFSYKGQGGEFFLTRELHPIFSLSLGVYLKQDSLEKNSASQSQNFITEGPTTYLAPAFKVSLGKLDKKGANKVGLISENTVSHEVLGKRFINVTSKNRAFTELHKRVLLGAQVLYQMTGAEDYLYQHNLSGAQVRGYGKILKNQKQYLQGNLELRFSGLDSEWISIDPVAFADTVTVFDKEAYASVGAGIRIKTNKLKGMCLSVDCGYTLDKEIGYSVGFGQRF